MSETHQQTTSPGVDYSHSPHSAPNVRRLWQIHFPIDIYLRRVDCASFGKRDPWPRQARDVHGPIADASLLYLEDTCKSSYVPASGFFGTSVRNTT
jgi:hypothetical protein